jgi:hypothetical protein
MVGINVVAFILTKKAVMNAPRGPPAPPAAQFALPQGGRVAAAVMERAPSSAISAPAVLMAGGGPGREPPKRDSHSSKKPDPVAFEKWIRKAQRRLPRETPEKAMEFQKKHAGAEEFLVEGGGKQVWADGARASDARLLDTKHVDKPETSPFIEGSACGDTARQFIRKKEADLLLRYAAVIRDPVTPAVGLEVIVNDARAVLFFESLMSELGIPGRVVVKAE